MKDDRKMPRHLPCGHHLCEECIYRLALEADATDCVLCHDYVSDSRKTSLTSACGLPLRYSRGYIRTASKTWTRSHGGHKISRHFLTMCRRRTSGIRLAMPSRQAGCDSPCGRDMARHGKRGVFSPVSGEGV